MNRFPMLCCKELVAMIPYSRTFDQQTMIHMLEHDPIVQRYRTFFALFDWSVVPEPILDPSRPGKRPHPQATYIKALLLKLAEGLTYCTRLRRFLLEHPLHVLELGFRPVLDITLPFGFDVGRTVPSARWLRQQQRCFPLSVLQALLMQTVDVLREEIPGLGEVVAFDVTHIYAWVRENNPRVYVEGTFDVTHIPKGDPDCRLGVKKSSNQVQADGTVKTKKESVFGYGSGIAAIPLNSHGHPESRRDSHGVPLCAKGLRMHPTFQFSHTYGYRSQRFRCPLLSPLLARGDLRSSPVCQRGWVCQRSQLGGGWTDARDAGSRQSARRRPSIGNGPARNAAIATPKLSV
jgi:hypothetical protein